MSVDPALRPLLAGFVGEAQDIVQKVTLALLELEKAGAETPGAAESRERVARGLHTLKGSSGTLGLSELSELSHLMEGLFAGGAARSSEVVDALLRTLDAFLSRLRAEAAGEAALPSLDDARAALARVGAAAEDATPAPAAPEAPAPPAVEDELGWRIDATHVGQLVRAVDRLRELALRLDDQRAEVGRKARELARADVRDVRAALADASRLLARDGETAQETLDAFEEGLQAVATLPARSILDPLQRTVRDLCRRSAKSARLSIVGGELSLDRRVLQALRGPLVHLVRNALDHGIEAPEERERRGKDREGLVVVRVEQHGNVLHVEVSDDGAGLDVERIRAEASRRALDLRASADSLTEAEVHALVFLPGFSTCAEVTETSGRGVGLDVVRSQVESLQGKVEVESRPGQGARFVLTVPVELGASPLLLARVGEHSLGVATAAVEQVRPVRADELRALPDDRSALLLDGRLVALVDLGAVLGIRPCLAPRAGQALLVVHAQGERAAVLVDEVLGHLELAVRPLPSRLRAIAAYQGAATLTRGELLLVLRPAWLVGPARATSSSGETRGRRALVVDDSLTARALHRAMLEAGGFAVHAASGGREALDLLSRSSYDVVVCDVAMEGMDGVELVKLCRARPETAALPIVLVSARGGDRDRARGLEAGADAFLDKKDCAAGRLLAEVSGAVARRSALAKTGG